MVSCGFLGLGGFPSLGASLRPYGATGVVAGMPSAWLGWLAWLGLVRTWLGIIWLHGPYLLYSLIIGMASSTMILQ